MIPMRPLREPRPSRCSRRPRDDNHGYTLQTVIVTSILLVGAVAASVILFQVINSNADVRSFTDQAATDAPSRPSDFQIEQLPPTTATIGSNAQAAVPQVKISWTPPVFSGSPQLPGTASAQNYKIRYGCAVPGETISVGPPAVTVPTNLDDLEFSHIDQADNFKELDTTASEIPTIRAEEAHTGNTLFTASITSVNCILDAQAYICPTESSCQDPNDKFKDAILGLRSEPYRFTLSRGAGTFRASSARATAVWSDDDPPTDAMFSTTYNGADNRFYVAWEPPEVLGAASSETLIYVVDYAIRAASNPPTITDNAHYTSRDFCVSSTSFSTVIPIVDATPADQTLDRIVYFRITAKTIVDDSRSTIDPRDNAATTGPSSWPAGTAGTPNEHREYRCPPSQVTVIDGETTSAMSEFSTEPPVATPNLDLTLDVASSEKIESTTTDAVKRTILNNNQVQVEASWTALPTVVSYELTWSRSDGKGDATTEILDSNTTSNQLILQDGIAYDFSLTANLANGLQRFDSGCATIGRPNQTPSPDIEIEELHQEILIRVSPPYQSNFCPEPMTTFPPDTGTQLGNPQHYKLRVYVATNCTSPMGDYPSVNCGSDDTLVRCIHHEPIAEPTATPAIPSNPISDGVAEFVISDASTAPPTYTAEVIAGHTCNQSGKSLSLNPPSSTPPKYGYPSVVKTATGTPDTTTLSPPSAPTFVPISDADPLPDGSTRRFDDTVTATGNERTWNIKWNRASSVTAYSFSIQLDYTQARVNSAANNPSPDPPLGPISYHVYALRPDGSDEIPVGTNDNITIHCENDVSQVTCTMKNDADNNCEIQVILRAENDAGISDPTTHVASEGPATVTTGCPAPSSP